MTIDQDGRNDGHDWLEMGDAWRSQPVLAPDIDAMRREANRRTRRMAVLGSIDVVATIAGIAMAVWLLRQEPGMTPLEWVVLTLLAIAMSFTGWTVWSRRTLWRDNGLSAGGLVALEMQRARNAMRYWRLNTLLMSAMFAVVLIAAVAQSQGWIEAPGTASWWFVLAITFALLLATVAFDRWRSKRLRARLRSLQVLADELRQ